MMASTETKREIMKKVQLSLIALLGIVLVGVALYYWLTPAGSLLHFVPGYTVGSKEVHFKHGLAALLLAAGCGLWLWFATAKKPATETPEQQ
jgi:hypothetical protein